MPGALIRLVQASLLLPSTALFIGLLTYHLQHGGLGLAWPLPAEPDGQIAIELALACLPAFALFLLAAAIATYCAVNLLASAYGNTWTASEILRGLFLAQLPQLGLASLPGLALTALLERLNHPRP